MSNPWPMVPEPYATVESLHQTVKAMKTMLDIMIGQQGTRRMANIQILGYAPSNPQKHDLWVDSSNANKLRIYDGSNWLAVTL